GGAADISSEHAESATRVFSQVKDVDFRSPLPPMPKKAPAGLEKKMEFLRGKVRELERDLARVGHIWRVKSTRIAEVERIITAKDAERDGFAQRYQQMRDQATRAAAQAHSDGEALNARLRELGS